MGKEVKVTEVNPWYYATKDKRDYITPEDITAAITAGGQKLEVWHAVLDALSASACEDPSLCAYVAIRYLK
jgi:hypothetical protein